MPLLNKQKFIYIEKMIICGEIEQDFINNYQNFKLI